MQIRVKQIRGDQAPISGFLFILTDSACLHLVSTYRVPGVMGVAVGYKQRQNIWLEEGARRHTR